MAVDNNPIYQYLKSEGVTDLNEVDFINKYTDRNNLRPVYDWLKSNENTDLEFEAFADKYFPLPKLSEGSSQGSENTSVTSTEPSLPSQNIKEVDTLVYDAVGNDPANFELDEQLYNEGKRRIIVDVPYKGLEAIESATRKGQFIIPEEAVGNNPELIEIEGKGYAVRYTTSDGQTHIAEEFIQEQPQQQEEEATGFWSNIGNSIAQIPAIFNESIYSIPEFLYNLGAVPQNLLASAVENNMGENAFSNYIRTSDNEYRNLTEGTPLNIINQVVDYAKDSQEYYNSKIKYTEDGIVDSFTNGKWSEGGSKIVGGIITSIPSMLTMYMTGGLSRAGQLTGISKTALTALPFASSNYQELADNKEISNETKILVSGLKGFAEIVFAQSFGTGKLIDDIVSGKATQAQVKEAIKGFLNKALTSNAIPATMFRGGIEEGTTQLSQNLIDIYSGVNPDLDPMSGVLDAVIVGSSADGVLSGGAKLVSKVVGTQAKKKVETLENEVNEIKKDLNNPNLDESVKDSLQEVIEAKTTEIATEIENSQNQLINLPKESLDKINDIENRLDDINETLASADENLSESTVQALEQQKATLEQEIDTLINVNSNNTQNQEGEIVNETTQNNTELSVEGTNNTEQGIKSVTEMSDAELEVEYNKLETDSSSEGRKRWREVEKEQEKREWNSIHNVSIEEAESNLYKLRDNEYSFIEDRDVRESLEVIEKFKNLSNLNDSDILSIFKEGLLGNPDSWSADGLKVKLSVQEAINRGITDTTLIDNVIKEFIEDGFTEKEARSVIAKRIDAITKVNNNNNETETEILNNTVVTDTKSTQPSTELETEAVTEDSTELEVEGEVVTPTQQRLQEIQSKREDIRQRIRTKYGTLNTGINPEQIKDYVELGATYVEEGVVRFSDFVTRLQDDFKDNPKLFDKLKDKDLREVFRQSVEANGLKVRGFVNSALDSPKVSDTTKTILQQKSEDLTYTPQVYSEIEERMSQTSEADKLTKIGQLSRITGELKDSDNDAILAGISLINQYEAEGRYDESAKVMEQMAKSATVIAQALRQYGEFKNSTPKGYIQLVETMLKEKGKELNPTNRAKIEQLYNEFQKATENFQKESENIANDLSKEAYNKYLEAEIALEKANLAVSDYVGRLYGKDTGALLAQIVQGNLLTLKSLIINPFSNTIQAVVRGSQNSVAWVLDQMFVLSMGQGSKIAPWDTSALKLGARAGRVGTQKAWRKAVYGDASTELNKYDINKRLKPFTAMSDLIKTFTSEDFNQEFPQTIEDILNNLAESTLGVPANLMFRMLPFGDDPFFQIARVWRLVEIGKKNKNLSGEALEKFVNKPDEKSSLEATEYAKSATFQDATKLAQFIRGIMNSVEDVISSKTTGVPYIGKTLDATTKVVLKSLIPFVGTPSSILQKTIRFAVPLIPTIEFGYNLSQYAKVVKRKGVNHEDAINWQRKIVESGAEVAISGAVISVAMTLVSLGLASGDAPDEQERAKERNFMFQTMPPNHLNVTGLKRAMAGGDPTYQKGDVTVSYMPLGLLGAQIGIVESTMGAKLREDVKKSKVLTTEGKPFYDLDKSKGLLNYMVNITDNVPASLKYFMSQSIVQSSNTLLEAVATGEYDQFGNQMVRTLSSLGVPNQVSQYFRATNDYMRDIYTEEDLQTWGNIIKEKTANVEDLPIRYNMWGEPVTQSPKGSNPYVYQMLDIFRSQKILEDELTYKVFDLFKKTQNTTVIPTSARDFFNEGDFTVKLNKEQKSELTRLVGERRKILAEKVMRSYTKDVEKPERYVERLKKAYSNGAKQGKSLFMKQLRDQGINIRANINLQTQDKQVELETNE